MKKWELIVLLGLCLAIILTSFSSFSNVCAAVREDTLRLHILANSDTKADQEAKLFVRDEILRLHGEMFAQSGSKARAVQTAEEKAELVRQTAINALREKKMSYGVEVEIVKMYFQTTQYDKFTMPAGRYDALRIRLGKASGKNWFCVMFPPLCVPAVQDEASPHYTQTEAKAVRSPYKIKFAVVEWLTAAKEELLTKSGS